MNKTKYIDLCRGEMRIGIAEGRVVSLSGGPSDVMRRKYLAIDALRERIGNLNQKLDDAIEATGALDRWEPDK